jgi:lauroyl/myristoyl acyltransferase
MPSAALEPVWAASMGALNLWTRSMSDSGRTRWAQRLGRLAPWVAPAKWRAVEENLAVLGAWAGKTFSARKVFENYGVTLSDFLSGANPNVRVEGKERADAARRGRGVVILTSHLGNWELGGRVMAGWGWPATAVYQPYRSAALHDFIQSRRAAGLNYLAVGDNAAAGVSRALADNHAVALLGDRPFGERGADVRVCGRTMRLPRGPFLLACRAGAAVVPGFALMEAPGEYCVELQSPLEPSGRGPEAAREMMERFARVLERTLALHAEQWYCFESVFSVQAPGV